VIDDEPPPEQRRRGEQSDGGDAEDLGEKVGDDRAAQTEQVPDRAFDGVIEARVARGPTGQGEARQDHHGDHGDSRKLGDPPRQEMPGGGREAGDKSRVACVAHNFRRCFEKWPRGHPLQTRKPELRSA